MEIGNAIALSTVVVDGCVVCCQIQDLHLVRIRPVAVNSVGSAHVLAVLAAIFRCVGRCESLKDGDHLLSYRF